MKQAKSLDWMRYICGLACVALVWALIPGAPTPVATAAPLAKEWAVTLTSAHISTVDATTPANPPVVVPPRGSFKAWFRVSNPYDTDVRVALDVTVVDPLKGRVKDATGAVTVPCTVPSQTSYICTRTFALRGDAPFGSYPVLFGIGLYDNDSRFVVTGQFDYDGWLRVEGQPVTPAVPASPASGTVLPASTGPGRYFMETGYWVRENVPGASATAGPVKLLAEYTRLGQANTLGYPVSRAFYGKDGFTYQAFQRAILQWQPGPDGGRAVLVNTMDWLHQAGKDDFLASLGIPRHYTGPEGTGPDFQAAKSVRLGWITDNEIGNAYFSNPSPHTIQANAWDPITFYGLPTSRAERAGAFTTQRFQRYVLQKWEEQAPGMPPPGSVIGVLVGDLAKEAGLVPLAAVEMEKP